MKRIGVVIAAISCLFTQLAAQSANSVYVSDAIRFSTPGLGSGARSLGMGDAYTGVANDYSALYWNPAGLAQLQYGEFSFGLSYLNYKDQSTYYGLSQSQANNSTTLNTLGLVFPAPVKRGSLVFAFGFNRESNYTTGMSLTHPDANSVIQSLAYDRDTVLADDLGNNIAWRLFLADTTLGSGHWRHFINNNNRPDSAFAYTWDSPIKDRVTQLEKVLEGGGLNDWSVGGAMDIARNLSLGITLTYQSGSYKYDGKYTERDDQNVYHSTQIDDPRNFASMEIADLVESDLSGVNARVGLLFRDPDRYRFGVSIKTPTILHVKETFGTTYTSTPDFGDQVTVPPDNLSNEYDLVTPWVFSAGGSLILSDLVLSADVDYTDWTQLEFRDANPDIIALNQDISDIFRATANVRVGAEYAIPPSGVRVRGGFMYNTSPFQGDPSSFDQKYFTVGLGIPLSEFTMFDLAYAHGWYDTIRGSYDGTAPINETVHTNNFLGTLSVRF